jgi:hypothetical protein
MICANSDDMCGYVPADDKLEKEISIVNPDDKKDAEKFTVQLVNCPLAKTKRIYQVKDDNYLQCKALPKGESLIINPKAYDVYRK